MATHSRPACNSSSAWAQNTSKSSHICSSVKMIPDDANVTANESVKLFSWCFSGVKRQHVSWSLKRFSPWVRAGGHACSDGGDTASSMKGGGGSWRKSIPRVSVLLRQVCRPLSHLIGQRSAACLDIHGYTPSLVVLIVKLIWATASYDQWNPLAAHLLYSMAQPQNTQPTDAGDRWR